MTKNQFYEVLGDTLDESHTGILATSDAEGQPSMRWMTPVIIPSSPGLLFAVTSKKFDKCKDLKANPNAQWMIQTKTLTKIITVSGQVNLIDNPSFKARVLEAIGPRLRVFWNVNENPEDIVVLETVMQEASVFMPMAGKRSAVDFNGDKKS